MPFQGRELFYCAANRFSTDNLANDFEVEPQLSSVPHAKWVHVSCTPITVA